MSAFLLLSLINKNMKKIIHSILLGTALGWVLVLFCAANAFVAFRLFGWMFEKW
jgi:hypothetical protein